MIRVLYAEDDPQIAGLVQLYFEAHGSSTVLEVVSTGRGCLEAMQRGGIDVLLLDLILPDLDGLHVLGELTARRDPTPIIMVSGHGQHELAVRAMRAGAVDCIDKNSPEFLRLPQAVERVYQRQRQQAAAPLSGTLTARDYHVLFFDSSKHDRSAAAEFFKEKGSRLHLRTAGVDEFDHLIESGQAFDAVVLGHNLETPVMLDLLRHLHSRETRVPVIVISSNSTGETAVAAFKLGAHDYLLHRTGDLTELVFSLNNALKSADTERLNAKLAAELAELNRSLADQVAERTRDLEAQIVVRLAAEKSAEENASRARSLSTRLLRVQEDERRNIAQELHDQIGQLLTGLRFQLEAARTAAGSPELGDALALTDELLRSVRELTLQLRPRILDDFGLKPALEWHTKLFGKQTGINVELELTLPPERFVTELETTIYRMVQEALTNVARHAGSKSALVIVTADDEAVQVEISDRGQGFDSDAALARRDSLGLAGLAERVRLAGGKLDIFSRVGQGTRLHAEFSLSPSSVLSSIP